MITRNVQEAGKVLRRRIPQRRSVRGNPHLVHNHCHHEQEINSECPEDNEFRALEVTSRDVVLLYPDQLIMFEGR
jgi:hypothetical protein